MFCATQGGAHRRQLLGRGDLAEGRTLLKVKDTAAAPSLSPTAASLKDKATEPKNMCAPQHMCPVPGLRALLCRRMWWRCWPHCACQFLSARCARQHMPPPWRRHAHDGLCGALLRRRACGPDGGL